MLEKVDLTQALRKAEWKPVREDLEVKLGQAQRVAREVDFDRSCVRGLGRRRQREGDSG